MLLALPKLLVAVALAGPAQAQGVDLVDELAAAVDLPTPSERRAAAARLAKRDIELDAWLAAMGAFGPRARAHDPGEHQARVELWAGDEPMETELHFYVPASYDHGRAAPLLVALHGTGGSGAGQTRTWQRVADQLGMLVLCPSDPGPNAGYAYTELERWTTLSAIRWMRRTFRIDPDRIHMCGYSRGGHLTWDLALRYPDRFASLAPMTGGPRLEIQGGRNNMRYLENVAHVSIRDLQGSRDDPLLLFNLRLAFERLKKWKAPDARLIEFPELGHNFDLNAVDWVAFLGEARRDPTPARVVRTFARPGEGRSHWVEVLEGTKEVQETFAPQVNASKWNRLSKTARQEYVQDRVDGRTARLEVTMKSPGRFLTRSESVKRFRLLLTADMLPDKGTVRVKFGSKNVSRKVKPAAGVLLAEFVERFDPGFLPVAEVVVP